jgi:lipoprotein
MNNIYKIILVLLSFSIFACSTDDNQKGRQPIASIKSDAENTFLKINQSMTIHFTGVADQVVIYPGDYGHNYALRDSGNTGIVVNKGLFTYSYSVPGKFHVVCIASTYNTYMGENLRTDTCSFDITVVDDVTTIDKIYSNIIPNTYYATPIDDENWILCLPTKQVFNDRDVILNTTRQRLYFDIKSDSTKIFVDLPDNERELLTNYNNLNSAQKTDVNSFINTTRKRYNLSKSHVITVRSDAGTIKTVRLYCMIYPEFRTVSLNGVNGVLKRDAFDQSAQTYVFTLPRDTNISNIQINYTVDGTGVLVDSGQEISSGANVNLTSGIFTIIRKSTENANIKATSKVKFEINYI